MEPKWTWSKFDGFRVQSWGLLITVLAAASAIPQALSRRSCNTGDLQCYHSTQTATITSLVSLGGLLGIALPSITGLVTCSGLNVGGIGGTSCSAQPVCYTNNTFGGLISLGCTPINLNL